MKYLGGQKRKNRLLAAGVVFGMLVLAGVTTAYVLATIDYRRGVDKTYPEVGSFRADALTVITAFVIVSSLFGLGYWLFAAKRRPPDAGADAPESQREPS